MPSCSQCQHSNPDNAKFCNQCGQALAPSCSRCGVENPLGARFCNQCGHALTERMVAPPVSKAALPSKSVPSTSAASTVAKTPREYTPKHLVERILSSRSAMEGERKQVTVLFADLKGSMDLAEQAGAERWHEILDEFFSILGAEIHRTDGTINQYTGDGVMALFGAPVAHEDHAIRACNAAWSLRDKLQAFGQRLRLEDGLNLSSRIGLNSGEVIVGRIGDDLRMDYTAQGHTVGLAARMESLAEPGAVYLTKHTARLVDGYFKLESLGESNIKGVSKPLEIFALAGPGRLKSRLDLSRARGLSPFVGRDTELAQLKKLLDFDVNGGKGGVALLEGGAGIGKSRLCHELAEYGRANDVKVYTAACVPYFDVSPLQPVREILADYLGITDLDTHAQARQKVAGALALLNLANVEALQVVFDVLEIADPSQAGDNLPAQARMHRLMELYRLFDERTPDRRSLVIVDDVQWIDAGSAEFLQHLWLAEASQRPVVLVLNFRPHERPQWLHNADLDLRLRPLAAADTEALTHELLGGAAELQDLRQRISERAAGHPYFVEEAIFGLLDDGALVGEAGALHLGKPIDEIAIPDTIQALLAARMDRLPEEAKNCLRSAAVIGKQFPRELLQLITKADDEYLGLQLALLQTHGFVVPTAVDDHCDATDHCHWEFVHPLVQEVAYHGQLKARRRGIHAALALAVEARQHGKLTADKETLFIAHHWQRAGNFNKAARWLVDAANFQFGNDMQDGVRRFRQAIEWLDSAPDSPEVLHGRVTARAGLLRSATFYNLPAEETEQAWLQAKAIVEKSHDRSSLAELQLSYGMTQLQHSDADDGVANTVAALKAVRAAPDAERIESRFRISLLIAFHSSGRLREGLNLLTKNVSPWTDGPVDESNYFSRGFRALMISYLGQLSEARADLHTAIDIARSHGSSVSWFHANVVEYCNLSGNGEEAMAAAKAGVRRAEEYRSEFFLANAYRQLGVAHCINRNWPEAIAACEKVLPISGYNQPGYQFRASLLAVLSRACLGDGQLDRAFDIGSEAIQLANDNHVRLAECQARLTMLSVLRKLKRDSQHCIEYHLSAIGELIEETGAQMFMPFYLEEQARLWWKQGDHARGEQTLQLAQGMYEQFGADGHAARLLAAQAA